MGIIARSDTGKFSGRFRNALIPSPDNSTIIRIVRLIVRLNINESPRRLTDSLSDFGRTMASSYLSDDATIIIPTRLRYTEYIPKSSAVKSLLSRGCSNIEIIWAIIAPETRTVALRRSSDLRKRLVKTEYGLINVLGENKV